MPEISVVMPAYNASAYIQRSIQNVFDQTFSDWELVVVDDGSTDSTAQIVRNFQNERVRYFHQTNQGPAKSRNFGLHQSCGRFVIFLDSDDWWHPDCLQQLHKTAIESSLNKVAVHCDWAYADGMGNTGQEHSSFFKFGEGLKTLALYNPFPIHAVLVSRSALSSLSSINFETPTIEDWEMWTALSLHDCRFIHYSRCLAYYHWRTGSKSKNSTTRRNERLNVLNRLWSRHDLPKDIQAYKSLSYGNAYIDFAVAQLSVGDINAAIQEFNKAVEYSPSIAESVDTYYRLIYADQSPSEESRWEYLEKLDEERANRHIEMVLDHLKSLTLQGHYAFDLNLARYSAYSAMAQALYAERRFDSAREYILKAMRFSKSPFPNFLGYLYFKSLFPLWLFDTFHSLRVSMKAKFSP